MYAEVAWVLVSSGTQVQLQVILDPDYLSDYLSVSYDYVYTHYSCVAIIFFYRDLSNFCSHLKKNLLFVKIIK